ncbi:hypothetical protein IE81DRAFT_291275, partial [Ceraceosorus guamensis]
DVSAKSDARRDKRAAERASKQRCYACRGMGHSAKDCPSGLNAEITGKETVGICFRCGSTEHTLARCRKAAKRNDEGEEQLPYATCFICSQKGHLSSKCPKGRGVYPSGGSCRLCSSTEHLVKDCPLSIRKSGKGAAELGLAAICGADTGGPSATGGVQHTESLGADEDDFHHFSRQRSDVERDRLQEHRNKVSRAPQEKGKKSAKVIAF